MEATAHSSKHILFRLDSEAYGVKLSEVKEIVAYQAITPVPHTPEWFLGIINLRGEIIAVTDLRKRLGIRDSEVEPKKSCIIVTEFDGFRLGCLVDEVDEVKMLNGNQIESNLSMSNQVQKEHLSGVAKLDDEQLVLLLNLQKVLSVKELQILKEETMGEGTMKTKLASLALLTGAFYADGLKAENLNLVEFEAQLRALYELNMWQFFGGAVALAVVFAGLYLLADRFLQFSLSTKLISGIASVLLFVVGLGVYLNQSLADLDDRFDNVSEELVPMQKITMNISRAVKDKQYWMHRYLRTRNSEHRDQYDQQSEKISTQLARAESVAEDWGELLLTATQRESFFRILESIRKLEQQTTAFEKESLAIMAMNIEDPAFQPAVDEWVVKADGLEDDVNRLANMMDIENARAGIIAEIEEGNARSIIFSFLLFILLWGSFVTYVIAASSVGLVKRIKELAKEMREGADQVAHASSDLSSSAQSLSDMSSDQASSVEETSASVEELVGMVNQNVESAEASSKTASEMKEQAQAGKKEMDRALQSMNEIMQSNEEIAKLVHIIEEIGEKTEVIDEIVFQTKLLSLNASVEAEKAGEHGKGFAVVAQEIGNLAQMSGKAANEIGGIVKESTRAAESIVRGNKEKVSTGNAQVIETAKLLAELLKRAEQVLEGSNSIYQSSKEQSTGLKQISEAVVRLDRNSQSIASSAEESSSVGEQLSAQSQQLNDQIEYLSSLVGLKIEKNEPQRNIKLTTSSKVTPIRQKVELKKFGEDKPKVKVAEGSSNYDAWESL